MTKQESVEALELAQKQHEHGMGKIKGILANKDMGELPSLYKTNCQFGTWLYDPNNNLKSLLGSIFYKELDTLHSQWHLEYRELYLLYFTQPDSDGISKQKKVTQMELDKAKYYYNELTHTTEKLVNSLSSCKRRLEALAPSKFEQKS